MKPIDKLPDYVIPLSSITTFLDGQNEVCGLMFEDTSGASYLIPIPGKAFAGLAGDMQKVVGAVHGLLEWRSALPQRKA